jgi:hypothetical protein
MRAHKTMIYQLLPGIVLPGLIYFIVAQHATMIVALAAASSAPVFDSIVRILRGKAPSIFGVGFLFLAGISIALAVWLDSPMFILAKGAVISGILGLTFAISALIRRPLTRTLAVSLSSDHAEGRRKLAAKWRNPKALWVFRVLSMGWGVLLLAMGGQQLAMVLTLSPGTVMTIEPAVQGFVTMLGIAVSVYFVRRIQQLHPEIAMLPVRSS